MSPIMGGMRTSLPLVAAAAVLALVAPPSHAGTPSLVLDAGTTAPWPWHWTSPVPSARVGTEIVFLHDDGLHGTELWASDGTAPGTRLVVDLCPGRCGIELGWATFAGLASNGSVAVFAGNDGITGHEPWVTDGTAAGTRPLGDLLPGPDGSHPWMVVTAMGGFAFTATDPTHGREPWFTDGTASGTRRLADLAPGPSSANPHTLAPLGDRLFVGTSLASTSFVVDAAGTVTMLTVGSGQNASGLFGRGLASLPDGDLVFVRVQSADDELWRLDAETLSPTLIAGGGLPGPIPAAPVTASNGALVATGAHNGNGLRGFATTTGTGLMLEPDAPGVASTTALGWTVPLGSGFVFAGSTDSTQTEPWYWEAGAGFVPLATIGTPEAGAFAVFLAAYPCYFCQAPAVVSVGSRALLFVEDASEGRALWSTDGTPSGTYFLSDLGSPGSQGALREPQWGHGRVADLPDGSRLFRIFRDNAVDLWRSDGTPSGTTVVQPLPAETDAVPVPRSQFGTAMQQFRLPLASAGRRVALGTVLEVFPIPRSVWWVVDGKSSFQVFAPDAIGSALAHEDALLFVGTAGIPPEGPYDLWRLGADTTVPTPLALIPPPEPFTLLETAGGWVWYTSDGNLVRTDLTPAGTATVAGLEPNLHTLVAGPTGLLAAGANAVIVPYDSTAGLPIADATGPLSLTYPGRAHPLGSGFVFAAIRDGLGHELWTSDGTITGTHLVRDIALGAADGLPNHPFTSVEVPRLAGFGSTKVLFDADDGNTGVEPWVSDGTFDGTQLLADLRPGPLGSWPRDFHAAGDATVFTANDGANGLELWVVGPAFDGPQLIDLAPGALSSRPAILTTSERYAWVGAWEPLAGRELWRVDLATLTPERLTDLVSGPESSSPSELAISGRTLYFVATDGVHGAELFELDDPVLALIFTDGFESGSASAWSP